MVFYIYDQGARISTPAEGLIKRGTVEQIVRSAPARAPAAGELNRHHRPLRDYQQLQDQAPRSKAFFAEQIMHQPVVAIADSAVVDDAWRLFRAQGCHHLPVIDAKRQLCGIVAERDLLRLEASAPDKKTAGKMAIAEVMQRRVVAAAEQTEIRVIADIMCRLGFSAMPIVNKAGEVVGIVTRSDILRALVRQAPLELWT